MRVTLSDRGYGDIFDPTAYPIKGEGRYEPSIAIQIRCEGGTGITIYTNNPAKLRKFVAQLEWAADKFDEELADHFEISHADLVKREAEFRKDRERTDAGVCGTDHDYAEDNITAYDDYGIL